MTKNIRTKIITTGSNDNSDKKYILGTFVYVRRENTLLRWGKANIRIREHVLNSIEENYVK